MPFNKHTFWNKIEKLAGILGLIAVLFILIFYGLIDVLVTNDSPEEIAIQILLNLLSEIMPVMLVGSVSFLLFGFIRERRELERRDDLQSALLDALTRGDAISESGLYTIHPTFPVGAFTRRLENAKDIRIMTTWINDTRRDSDAFIRAIKRSDSQTRILMLDPEAPCARQRSLDLGYENASFVPHEIRNSLDWLRRSFGESRISSADDVAIKTYRALPSMQIYICDNHAFVGFYWHLSRSTSGVTLELHNINRTPFGGKLLLEFDKQWRSESSKLFPL